MARPSDTTAKVVDKQSSGMSSTSSKGVVADDGNMASGPVWVTSGWVPKHMFNDEVRAATYLKELDRECFCSRDYRKAFATHVRHGTVREPQQATVPIIVVQCCQCHTLDSGPGLEPWRQWVHLRTDGWPGLRSSLQACD